jgi:hypothetical protein
MALCLPKPIIGANRGIEIKGVKLPLTMSD